MRVNVLPTGLVVADPQGPYETPIESELLHRFRLEGDAIVDTYNGVSDDKVRSQDAKSPRPGPEPVTPPEVPEGPADGSNIIARLDDIQAQLDSVTAMLLEG
jgi:hypothetical protein